MPPDLQAWARARLDGLVQAVLARDENGPRFRSQAAAVFIGLLWFAAVLVERPVPSPAMLENLTGGLPTLVARLVELPILLGYAIFHPNSWRHLILPLVIIQLSLRAGARYLKDLLELENDEAAQRYIGNAIFGQAYEWLEIKDGQAAEVSQTGTVFKIGGPGYLKIHLGNAALFERVDGASTIAAATHRQFLHGFERYGEVVDLRDQIRRPADLRVYTRDGIAVNATDIQVVFRLWSGRQSRHKNNPYPLDKKSVRQVVYGSAVGSDQKSLAWPEVVAEMAAQEVARYIGGRQLSDLIAQKTKVGLSLPDQNNAISTGQVTPANPVARGPLLENTRRPLSLGFYEPEAVDRFEAAGVELIWIGVGTLNTPPEITAEWISAWQTDVAAQLRSKKTNPDELRRKERGRIIERLLTDINKWCAANQISLYSNYSSSMRGGTMESDRNNALDRIFSLGSSQQLIMDVLHMYRLRLDDLRNNLPAEELSPEINQAVDYIKHLLNPPARIIGGEGD